VAVPFEQYRDGSQNPASLWGFSRAGTKGDIGTALARGRDRCKQKNSAPGASRLRAHGIRELEVAGDRRRLVDLRLGSHVRRS